MNERPPSPDDFRDADVDAAWRAQSRDEPPAAIDDAIRAAARREVGSRPGGAAASSQPRQDLTRGWRSLAAAAAIGALAFGVLRWLPPEGEVVSPLEPRTRSTPEPAPRALPDAARPTPSAPSTSERAPSVAGQAVDDGSHELKAPTPTARRGEREESTRDSSPAGLASPSRVPVGKSTSESAPQPQVERPTTAGSPISTTPEDSAAATAAETAKTSDTPATEARSATQAAPTTMAPVRAPDDWVREIVALHAAGEFEQAATQLRLFRAHYRDADSRLPDELRAWAASIRD